MKAAIQIFAAAGLGAAAAFAIPSNVIDQASSTTRALSDRVAQIKLADLNPVRALYDWQMAHVAKGQTPEELGFHGSAVTVPPTSFASPGYDPRRVNSMGNGFGESGGELPPDGPH
jgi:hypothetical protein